MIPESSFNTIFTGISLSSGSIRPLFRNDCMKIGSFILGIFIGGSIAAKIVPKMKDPIFMQSFLNKGGMEPLLKEMPVKIVLNDESGIIGAARYTLVQKAFRTANRA